ncbi:glycosyltransferase [Natrialbaceae archaeon A-CW3]
MTTLTTSVIVPAKEEADRLGRTLHSLANQRTEPDEVIVVASGEATVTVAREHARVDVVVREDELRGNGFSAEPEREPHRRARIPRADGGGHSTGPQGHRDNCAQNGTRTDGPGWARNRGAERANGDVLLFTDADTVVPPTWVADHRRHYQRADVVGVGGPLDPLEAGLRHRVCFRFLSDWWYRVSWPLGFVQQPGPNCSVRRVAFERCGGFDESLAFLEDTDLSLRLRRDGDGEIVYDSGCRVETSVRRQEREGYGGLFLTYARGYLAYFVPGMTTPVDYF